LRSLSIWLLRLAAGTASTLIVASVLSAPAKAFESYYYCELKPVGQWCDGRANGSYDGINSWDFHEAWYPGTWDNTVNVCQRLYRPSDGSTRAGDSCNLNYVSVVYGTVTCYCYEAEARQYSGGPHSVWGHAIAN
jgi:hypothetical protein